ncbi:WecB/TagA/CpsF family glycosyltransferase [Desulfobacter latus]|uniref:WecB/TagA/CpsF family glycosyltransferase n=1 Tax=Desulfobacter latus TaxID=2292 RepID=A0A850SUK5_9BACT|nr:WecB/TagA/CpsF family glycosyltransferase [Desulfobacter latus]NWH03700.1 WecB/TagA/CpsF family glycosyltransferase [Desulfobacter latus]
MNKINIFDYEISSKGCFGDIEAVFDAIYSGKNGAYMACANPHSLVKAGRDPVFKSALHNADVLLPDGSGIVLAAKLLNLPLTEKVAGSDFFRECNKKADATGNIRYFFLGSSEKVLSLMTERLNRECPNVTVCGTYSPPFKPDFSDKDNTEMIKAVNEAKPDILWVGMTAPKQEKWIYENRHRLNVPFSGAIGAVFDFYAGTKERSSQFWINLGLEWLPRFLKEPRRLWERNIKSTPIFLWWVLLEMLKPKRNKN